MDTPAFQLLCPHGEEKTDGCLLFGQSSGTKKNCPKAVGSCFKRISPAKIRWVASMEPYTVVVPDGLEFQEYIEAGNWVLFIDAIAIAKREKFGGNKPMLVLDHNDTDHDLIASVSLSFYALDGVITKPADLPGENMLVLYAPATQKEIVCSSRFLRLA